jgi:HEAT repeat protein
MTRSHKKTEPETFSRVLEALRNVDQLFPPALLYHFSSLQGPDLAALEAAWPGVEVERRRSILIDLHEIGEANFEVSFDAVFRLALEDADPEVRATAIRGLWEAEELDLVAPMMDLMQHDPAPTVRAAAASALGRYIYLGEVDDIPALMKQRIEDALLAVIRGPDLLEVRRRALEAIGYSSRAEVAGLIQSGYDSADEPMRVSAVFAMGRHSDPRWTAPVLAELERGSPELRFEAARAAGEMQLSDAVQDLERLIQEGDGQGREAALWSLGEIGGPQARRILSEQLALAEDETEQEFIEDALENLDFTDDMANFTLMELENDDLEDDEEDASRLN